MAITWLQAKEKNGIASFYNTNITLNTIASIPFEYAYRCQVGITDDKNIVIEPLTKDNVLSGKLDEYNLLKISIKPTYSRIASTLLMTKISEILGLELSDRAIKFETIWNEEENHLIIKTNREEKK